MNPEYQNLFFVYLIGLSTIISITLVTYYISYNSKLIIREKYTSLILLFSIIFYVISILYLTFGKINALHQYADFATHLEILWKNTQGVGLKSLMSSKAHGGSHWFAAHFTPIIYLTYVPGFALLQNAYAIPILETLFITSSLIPLWLLSKRYLDRGLSKLFLCCFLFYPTIFYTNLYGISYIELSIPLLLWLFYFFEKKNNTLYIVFLILCLMTREEVSLVTCFFGIYILILKRYYLGIFTIVVSLVYFFTVLLVVMPFFSENVHITTRHYQNLGSSYSEILSTVLLNPLETIMKAVSLPKIGSLVIFLIPLFFIPISNFLVFLIATPNLAITFFSEAITHSSYILYYLSPSIPIFFYATITGINKFKKIRFYNINSIIYSILIASITTTIFFGATPISIAYWNKDYKVGKFYTTNFHRSVYIEEDRDIAAKKIVKLIPENAVISAEQHFLPLLYKKKKMVIFPQEDKNMEYVLIDILNPKKTGSGDTYLSFRLDPEFYYQKYLKNDDWTIIAEDKGVILLKNKKNNL